MTAIVDKEAKCLRISKMVADGRGVVESCREIGMSEKTFQRWRRARNEARTGQQEQRRAAAS